MRRTVLPIFVLAATLAGKADEVATKWDVDVPPVVPIEGSSQPLETPNSQVLASRTASREVLSAPDVEGGQSDAKTVNVTVQLLADPGPLATASSPAKRVAQQVGDNEPNQEQETATTRGYVYVSARVYNGTSSHIKIFPGGNEEGAIEAWSNIDFNLFTGTGKMLIKHEGGSTEEVTLMIGLENVDTQAEAQRAAFRGLEYEAPQIPSLPDLASSGAAFSVIEGGVDDAGMARLEQIHDLYRSGHEKLEQARDAVMAARAARQARLEANPPSTDVKIRVWTNGASTNQERSER